MADYTLKFVKGQSFHGSENVSDLLVEAADFVAHLEPEVTVLTLDVSYDEATIPYVSVFYETV